MNIHLTGDDTNSITITRACPGCCDVKVMRLDRDKYHQWLSGMPIQEAFPHFDADTRERLLTGICNTCWLEYLGGPEDV